jgi:hypothetical protein
MPPSPSRNATVAVVLSLEQVAAIEAVRQARRKATGTLPSVSAIVREALVDFARFHGVDIQAEG